jgi:hypothetical protein
MIEERWLSILEFIDAKRSNLTPLQRANIAATLAVAEHTPGAVTPPMPTRWFEITDMGLMNEEMLRAKLALEHPDWLVPPDLDGLMVVFAMGFGKVVTPTDQAVPPFYLINGGRESIYQLRLRAKALHVDDWNTWPRADILSRLRENGDAIQEL